MEIKVNFLDNLRLEAKFDDFTVEHVYRDQNKEADEQANLAMDRGY